MLEERLVAPLVLDLIVPLLLLRREEVEVRAVDDTSSDSDLQLSGGFRTC